MQFFGNNNFFAKNFSQPRDMEPEKMSEIHGYIHGYIKEG